MTSRTFTSTRLRTSVVAVVAAAVLALTACNTGASPGGGGSTSPTTSATFTPSATPTPTAKYKPADAKGKAQNVPLPVKPALADENSKEGLEAFAKYWYSLMNYAYETGTMKPIDEITNPSCASCTRVRSTIESWNTDGKWIEGGALKTFNVSTKFTPDTNGDQQVFVQYHRLTVNYRQAGGTVKETFPKSDLLADIFLAKHDGAKWIVTNVDRVGG